MGQPASRSDAYMRHFVHRLLTISLIYRYFHSIKLKTRDLQLKIDLHRLNEESPAPFGNDTIHNFYQYLRDNDLYLHAESKSLVMDIPLDKIVGIDQMYGGKTWAQCLNGSWLKRIDSNLSRLKETPEYYLCDRPKKDIYFTKVNDKYFIVAGKHRTIISRFLAHFNKDVFNDRSPLRNISVTEYFVDTEYTRIKHEIAEVEKLYPHLKFELEHTTSVDSRRCLIIQQNDHPYHCELFSRSEVWNIISILRRPKLKDKLVDSLSSWKPGSNIYNGIS